MPNDVVSIVVPAYNHARYLDEAIASIRRQDYPHIELIVIDDGSTDDTVNVLSKYTGEFKWETQPNAGQSSVLAKGWAAASGSILAYLSADDALLPGVVSKSVQALRDHPEAVLTYCDFELMSPESVTIRRVKAPEVTWPEMVGRIVCAPGPGAFFRRTAYEEVGPWDPSLRKVADFDFFLRLRRKGDFHHIPEVLARFRVHPESQSYAATDERGAEEFVQTITRYFEAGGLPEEVNVRRTQALGRALLLAARAHIRAGRWRRARVLLMKAWRTNRAGVLTTDGARILFNALFNRALHAVYWRVLRYRKPPEVRPADGSEEGRG